MESTRKGAPPGGFSFRIKTACPRSRFGGNDGDCGLSSAGTASAGPVSGGSLLVSDPLPG